MRYLCFITFLSLSTLSFAQKILRIAAYGGEIPSSLIHDFEHKTGIKVYLSTFESNENLLLKLKSSKQNLYDLVTPSHYYVKRFSLFGMLKPLDLTKIPNTGNIAKFFLPSSSDKVYGLPFVYGASGIFYHHKIPHPPLHWEDLWQPRFENQLLMLDDTRELFSMALIALNLNPNTKVPQKIDAAYQHLLKLSANIKILASDAVTRIIVDEDALAGMAWNGDVVKARQENQQIQFVFPKEGYILWAECFAIPSNANHVDEAYAFINFVLAPKNAAEITKQMHYPVTVPKARQYLPQAMTNDPILYPSPEVLQRGIFQQDASERIITLYNSYWESFKMSF